MALWLSSNRVLLPLQAVFNENIDLDILGLFTLARHAHAWCLVDVVLCEGLKVTEEGSVVNFTGLGNWGLWENTDHLSQPCSHPTSPCPLSHPLPTLSLSLSFSVSLSVVSHSFFFCLYLLSTCFRSAKHAEVNVRGVWHGATRCWCILMCLCLLTSPEYAWLFSSSDDPVLVLAYCA